MLPTLVLTRPEAQSRRLAAEFGGGATVVISPVLEIVGTGATVDLSGYRGVILTSANAVAHAPGLCGMRAYCVGNRTAAEAREKGATVVLVVDHAEALVSQLKAEGPLLHLRGEHARGNVAKRLTSAGIETHEAVVYRQVPRSLSTEARTLIEGEAALVLPLFSPRTAALVGAQVGRVGKGVRVIAMSPAVARQWREATGGAEETETCARPTGEEMRARIGQALRQQAVRD